MSKENYWEAEKNNYYKNTNKHYHGEKLIDADKIDPDNRTALDTIRRYIEDILNLAAAAFERNEQRIQAAYETAKNLRNRFDIKKMERRKTIVSNILFFLGSAISPARVPNKMLGKQKMPEKTRIRAEELQNEITDLENSLAKQLRVNKAFRTEFEEIKEDILSSDEKMLSFLASANKSFMENDCYTKHYNSAFFLYALTIAGYLDLERALFLGRNAVSVLDAKLQERLYSLNHWYVCTYGKKT